MRNRYWLDRPTLVTGATGLLGGRLVAALHQAGADIVCLIRDAVPQCELIGTGLIEKVKVVRGDIRDRETMERALKEYEVNTVFHLAAQTQVGIANRDAIGTFDANIRGTWQVLDACRSTSSVLSVVQASSDKAYGSQKQLPYTEDASLIGEHPYDVSKSCADLLARCYALTYKLPVGTTRCGNLYGGGDLNWNRLVPGTIRSVLRSEAPIIRSDGLFVRDYLYVDDAADGYMLLGQQMTENKELAGQAFNFSTEAPLTVIQVVEATLLAMGSPLKPVVLNAVSNEIREQYLSAERAHRVLGWKARYDMASGLSPTIDWYREYFRRRESEFAAAGD